MIIGDLQKCLEKGVLKLSVIDNKLANRKQCIACKSYIEGAATDQNVY